MPLAPRSVWQEREEPPVRTNDELAETVVAASEFAIDGVLGPYDGLSEDVDRYLVLLSANKFYLLSVTSSIAIDVELTSPAGRRVLAGATERELYTPFETSWVAEVSAPSRREARYRLVFEQVNPVVRPGSDDGTYELHAGRGVGVVRFDLPAAGVITAETLAERLPTPSPATTFLHLRPFPAKKGQEVISGALAAGSVRDRRLAVALEPGTYQLVADAEEAASVQAPFSVHARLTDGHSELEPNDVSANASAFLPPVDARLGTATSTRDVDLYQFRARRGELLSFVVAGTGALPALTVRASDFVLRQPNAAGEGVAALRDVMIERDGLVEVGVGGRVGSLGTLGALYRLEIEAARRYPVALGRLGPERASVEVTGRLSVAGDKSWYRFGVEGETRLVSIDVERLVGFEPELRVFRSDGVTSYRGIVRPPAPHFFEPGDEWLSVTSAEGSASDEYRLRLSTQETLGEVEPNSRAIPMLVALPAALVGRLDGMDEDAYAFELQASRCVELQTIQTSPATHETGPNTTLSVFDAAGVIVGESDDHDGIRYSRLSALVLGPGPFVAIVRAADPGGEYALVIQEVGCGR
ncbi:MAG: hypothetical protein HY791_13490 [Deltaproteobacteria bacterium]|nr:hypothetical protein [Deltaproteobacteria bacterium]